MLAHVLEQAGIEAHIHGEALQSAAGSLPVSNMLGLLVADEAYDRARDLIKEWERAEAPRDPNASPSRNLSTRRIGVVLLLCLFWPVVFVLANNMLLALPLAWALAHITFRWTFPPEKQASVNALGVQVAVLAWHLLAIIHLSGTLVGLNVQAVLLAIGLLWLYFGQSRMAAGALIVLHAFILISAVRNTVGFNFSMLQNARQLSTVLGSTLSVAIALLFSIGFLIAFIASNGAAARRES
jgi:hypothetical protein